MLKIKMEDSRLKALNTIRELNADQLYIVGDGYTGHNIKMYLQSVGGYKGKIFFIVDDEYYDSKKIGVVPFSQFLVMNDRNSPIVIGLYDYEMIFKKKAELSKEFFNLYDFHITVINGNRLQWNPFLAQKREYLYQKTYSLLSDDRSKKVLQLYLNAAIAGEFHELFTECYEEPSYFNRITKNLTIDTLIDCGAFDGDSVHDFVAVFPNYKKIIAFEPDPVNFEKLCRREKKENIRNIALIKKGVSSSNGHLFFQANGYTNSFLSDKGDIDIQVAKLDDVINDTVGQIMIKMDIEGSELDALHGARNMLQTKSPILAICVYHKETDLIEIPQFIHKIVGDNSYDYYLGFHGKDLYELVFYAIPKILERYE